MTCRECKTDSQCYVSTCAWCIARFCATLPTNDSADRTEALMCERSGVDRDEVRRIGREIARDRMMRMMGAA